MTRDKFYIIAMDNDGLIDTFNLKSFHERLTTANGIKAWWHYLTTIYIIKVEFGVTASNISEYIMSIAPQKQFFTCELKLENHNGFLPKDAWDWINNNNK